MSLSIDDLKAQNLILFECISGSRAYGLATETSDTDIKGVFYLPKSHYYSLRDDYIPQVSNESNDIVYYELGRFIELLIQNNPTVLELYSTAESCILYQHPLMQLIRSEWIFSQKCQQSFAGFAQSQIKKARGLNKKINQPMAKERKTLLDFCYILQNEKSIPLEKWLEQQQLQQQQLGLVQIPHTSNLYAVFVDKSQQYDFSGIIIHDDAMHIALSAVPQGLMPIAYLSFNQSAFSQYCQRYQEYWQWVEQRNETRYQTTLAHGKQYDAKNMMHTIRLLQMALELAQTGQLQVQRPNRDELLAIKAGQYEYDELLAWAKRLSHDIQHAFSQSQLPEQVNEQALRACLVEMRMMLYK